MTLQKTLENLGIHEKKAEVYLACLELGSATAYLIAKKVGLKRPTVYDLANQLMREGLLHKSMRGNVKYFSPADPEKLVRSLREKEHQIRRVMPELQNLYNSPKAKPLIRYFEGKAGIMEMYEDSLRSCKKGDEILAYVGEDILRHLPEYTKDYVARRVEKGIVLRGIYKNNQEMAKYLDKSAGQLRITRILDEKNFPVNNETNIYKNKIAIASYGKEMFGMIVESEEIARSQKAIFELAWKGAGRIS
ncbi:MAG: helix-turn-helix domain-containing protein [Candidatus Moranbacteria bacterium]|nr:helix-turn-helix domain-containing protein [Candidatus Moranbacteria bacterium]